MTAPEAAAPEQVWTYESALNVLAARLHGAAGTGIVDFPLASLRCTVTADGELAVLLTAKETGAAVWAVLHLAELVAVRPDPGPPTQPFDALAEDGGDE